MTTEQAQALKTLEKYGIKISIDKYACGIPKVMISACPGKHETTNTEYILGPCFVCEVFNSDLHELFYHKVEEFWEKPEGRKTEAERVRKM